MCGRQHTVTWHNIIMQVYQPLLNLRKLKRKNGYLGARTDNPSIATAIAQLKAFSCAKT